MSKIDWSKAPEWADRVVRGPMTTFYYWADDEKRVVLGCESDISTQYDKIHIENNWEVVERRPDAPKYCESVMRQMPGVTIEQRIASLRALEKQVEETRAELTRDLEALGLTWMVRDEPEQPTITDWRDLRVGDVVAFDDVDGECVVAAFPNLENRPISARKLDADCHLIRPDINVQPFRFIRRP